MTKSDKSIHTRDVLEFFDSGTSFPDARDIQIPKSTCPEPIKLASQTNRLVVFAGSGVSIPTNRPNWDSLVKSMIAQCTADGLEDPRIKAISALTLSEETVHRKLIPSIVKHIVGISKYHSLIQKSLETQKATRASRYHNLILNLNPCCIITTNYDNCFEICAKESNQIWNEAVVEDYKFDLVSLYKEQRIFHLHGMLSQPASVVLGLDEYTRVYRRADKILRFLAQLFESYSVVFIGCSMRDEEVLGELLECTTKGAHHALVEDTCHEKSVFECLGIPVTTFQKSTDGHVPNSFYQMENILSDWAIDLNNSQRQAGWG